VEDKSALVGTSFPSYSFTVERGKIWEFAQAIGDSKDVYLDPQQAVQAGYADVTAPPTFGTVVDMWGGPGFSDLCRDIKANPVKVLHGEQEYEYLGDIVAGDTLMVSTTVTGYTEKKNMHLTTLEKVYVNQRSEEVLKCRMLIVELK
jgi:acyl dehydratase